MAKESSFNKDCIADAVVKLLQTKKLSEIKIDDIVKVSGFSRITYFRHFDSKYDAIAYKLRREYEPYKAKYSDEGKNFNYDSMVKMLRFHLSYKDSIYSRLSNDEFSIIMVLFSANQFKNIQLCEEDEFRSRVLIYSYIGVMSLWKEHDFKETPDAISKYIEGIIK